MLSESGFYVGKESHANYPHTEHSIASSLNHDYVQKLVADVPEKRLMFAVLLDAVIQLRRRNTARSAEAERWIRGEDGDEDTPFSFTNVCETLGIDPSYLARGLLAWRAGVGTLPPVARAQVAKPRFDLQVALLAP